MSKIVRIGIAGAGVITQRGLIPHLKEQDIADRVKLQAICDPAPGRAQELAEKHGIPEFYTDYDQMLASETVDAVTIATPIGLHFRQSLKALQAGKHVHVNKTMTTTVAEATELIELADSKGLHIVASPGEVLRPQNHRIRQLLDEGAIGTPSWILGGTASASNHLNEPERNAGKSGAIAPDWYYQNPGGGPLYDLTVYPLHTLTTIMGPVKRVTAQSKLVFPELSVGDRKIKADADDTTVMLLEFGDGTLATIYGVTYGSVLPGIGTRLAFFGSEGSIIGDEINGEPFDFEGKDLVDREGRAAVLPHVVGNHRSMAEPHVYEDVMQLVDWIVNGEPSFANAHHARHVVDIIESAYRSAKTGTSIELSTTFDRVSL